MQYNGVPVDELYNAWKGIKDEEERRKEAGKIWDAKYREKHREERNQKAKEYYHKRKQQRLQEDKLGPPSPKDA